MDIIEVVSPLHKQTFGGAVGSAITWAYHLRLPYRYQGCQITNESAYQALAKSDGVLQLLTWILFLNSADQLS